MQNSDIERIFADRVKDKGGRVIIEDLSLPLNRILNFYKNKYARKMHVIKTKFHPEMPDIYLDFIMNPTFNAQAFIEKNHWFIGINEGTIFVITALFLRMLSDSRILTKIGNGQIEEAKPPLLTYWNTNSVDLFHNNVDIKPPKDPVRTTYARLLSEIAIDFLFAHEYTHLSNGHVSFIEKIENQHSISEFEFSNNVNQSLPDDYKLTRQTLEYDADSGAVHHAWATIWGRVNKNSEVREEYSCFYENIEDALFTWWFAIFSLFQIFETQAVNFEKLTVYYHPQTTIRTHMILPTMFEYMKTKLPQSIAGKLYRELIGEVIAESATSFQMITGFQPKEEYLKNIMQIYDGAEGFTQSSGYVQSLLEHWKVLRPQLLPFAKGGGLAL